MPKTQTLTFALLISSLLGSPLAMADTSQIEALKARIQTRDRTLITHVEPEYPSDAFQNGVTGSVIMSFTINIDGSISNIAVLSSEPKGVFEAASIAALSKWKYAPLEAPIDEVKTQFDFAF